jgi:beta-glucosidase
MKDEHRKIIEQMTVKEKAEATAGYQGRGFVLERLGQEGFMPSDNPRGGMGDYIPEPVTERKEGEYYPVSFPQAAHLSATWDEKAVEEVGAAMGRACKGNGIDVLLRPGVNIKRSPLCGRNFEYYSEDPYLTGKLAAAFIRGVQSQGTAACIKHYAVNNHEFERMTTNAVISERALREIYLRGFEIAIKESKPWTLMTSYNKVNGKWVPENELLMGLLKNDFGFDGMVMSDAMAIHTEKVRSHRYGMDLELANRGVHTAELQDAVDSGILDESNLDASMERMLILLDKIRAFDPLPKEDTASHRALARRVAAEGITLLQNDGILPLNSGSGQKILVAGALAKTPNPMGGGSGHMNGSKVDIPFDEVAKLAGSNTAYAAAYRIAAKKESENPPDQTLIAEMVKMAKQSDVVIFFAGLPTGYESEGFDRQTLALPSDQIAALNSIIDANENVVLVNASGSAVDLAPFAPKVRAILHSYSAGETMGGAMADVLFGKAEPEGHITETFPLRLQDTPAYLSLPHYPQVMRNVVYGEDIFVGYRWYEKRDIPVLFPFGHGMSYTSFSYSSLSAVKKNGKIEASITITNTGNRRGAQVLQLYIKPVNSSAVRPIKELKAFKKVRLESGAGQTVTFVLDRDAFSWFDEEHHRWIMESGKYELLCGISSESIKARTEVDISGGDRALVYNKLTAVEWVSKDPHTPEIAKNYGEPLIKSLFPDNVMGELGGAMPIYRLTEGAFGPPALSGEQLTAFLSELNNSSS